MYRVLRSLRGPFRLLWQDPWFAWPVILALMLGIGATTAVFSVFWAMLLDPMGFAERGRVVALWATDSRHGQKQVETNYRDLEAWRTASDIVESVALVSSVNLDFTLFTGGQPQTVDGTIVSGSFFRVTGTRPFAGRLLNEADDQPGVPARAVLSYGIWRSRFGGDLHVIGRTVRVGSDKVNIVGVAPPKFDFPRNVGLWIAIHPLWPDVEHNADLRVFGGVARLRRGVAIEQARARLNLAGQQVLRSRPAGADRYGLSATPILDEVFGSAKVAVEVLLGAVLLVLLIACANAGNLLLVRANARSGELAMRVVMGAGRAKIVGLLLTESACLAAVAGAGGVLLAQLATKAIVHLAPVEIPRIQAASVNGWMLAFSLLVTLTTVLLFGLVPGWLISQIEPYKVVKQSGPRTSGSKGQTYFRKLSIVGEVALSAFLLVGAGLLLRTYAKLSAVDPGFQSEHVLTFRVTTERADNDSRVQFYNEVLDKLRASPGVQSAAAVLIRPLSGAVGWDTDYTMENQSEVQRRSNPNGNFEAISSDYFRTMGIRLMAGRDFSGADTAKASPVLIINEGTARRHFTSAAAAVGRRVRLGNGPKAAWGTIVGVVHDVRYREWEAARPDFYVPFTQRPQHRTDFVLKSQGDPLALAEAASKAVQAVDKNQPVSNVATLADLVDEALARSRFSSLLIASLAGVAILLAGVGIYSVLSYTVGQSAFEIALRMAVGAQPMHLATLVAQRGLAPVVIGTIVGLGGAVMAQSLVATLLFGVSGTDPISYGVAFLVLLSISATAAARPAFRAARTNPIRLLKS